MKKEIALAALNARRDEIAREIYEIDKAQYRYQIDVYMYDDGTTFAFDNPGGNSWTTSDHIVLCKINNEWSGLEDGEEFSDFSDNSEYYYGIIDNVIDEIESEIKPGICYTDGKGV